MNRKTVVSLISAASLMFMAATCSPALAFGGHGHGRHGGDGHLMMLAHAAGLTGQQIHTAFKNDPNLKTDFTNLKTARTAMNTCIVAGTCTNQVATYASAQQALTQEKMTIWQNLFASAPNKAQATSVMNQMTALNEQKHALMKQIFSSAKSSGTPVTGGPQTEQ
ncbi:MAG TPA: hypothetical protein VN867_04770 [Candidatus Binataceae bacterium]|nr:hypothetical protein [Candidatus Binataceae bacterium]